MRSASSPLPALGSGPRIRAGRDPSLWIAVGVAAALRLLSLGEPSLWLDEAISARVASLDPAAIVEAARQDLHPPGYYLLLSLWVRPWPTNAAGLPTEWAIRSLSAAASIGLVPLLYMLGAAWAPAPGARQRVARWSAWIAALSPFALSLAGEARAYALLATVLAGQLLLWTRLRERGGRWPSWLLLGSLLVAGFYLHYLALLFPAALIAVGARAEGASPGFRRRGALTLALSALPILPWLPTLYAQAAGGVRGWLPFSHSPLVIARTVAGFFRGADAGWLQLSLWAVPVIYLAVLGARRGGGALATCLLLPMGAAYAISLLAAPVFDPRYLAGSAVAAWLLAARGIASGGKRHRRWRLSAAAVLVAGMVLGAAQGYGKGPGVREDWRGLVAGMEASAAPGTPVLFAFEAPVEPFSYYAAGGPLRGVGCLEWNARGAISLAPALEAEVGEAGTLWYVTYLEGVYDPQSDIRSWLDSRGFTPAAPALHAGTLIALPLRRDHGAGS